MIGIAGEDRPRLASLVQSMYEDKERNKLDVEAASREIDALAESLDGLRVVCERFATDEELLVLAKKARSLTQRETARA